MAGDPTKAYAQTQRQTLTAREAEAMALTKAAIKLEDARNKSGDQAAFADALRHNNLLWTIFQADIADPRNELPSEIKANVMSLSIFVDKQTNTALREGNPKLLSALININRQLAAGLRGDPGDAAP